MFINLSHNAFRATAFPSYHSCVASQDYYGGYFANNQDNADAYEYNGQYQQGQGDENQQEANAYGNGENGEYQYGNGYYQNEERNNYQGMYEQKLVHFKLCPTDNCGSCPGGADYVVDLAEFVDTFLEAKMTAEQYNCEQVRENCYCGNQNYEYQCLQTCNANSPFDYCDKYNNDNQQNQNGQVSFRTVLFFLILTSRKYTSGGVRSPEGPRVPEN